MKNLKFNRLYGDMSEEDILFLSLKYDKCHYKIEYHELLQTNIIQYDEPASWPAFFVITTEAGIRSGVFTDKKSINLAFVENNKEYNKEI